MGASILVGVLFVLAFAALSPARRVGYRFLVVVGAALAMVAGVGGVAPVWARYDVSRFSAAERKLWAKLVAILKELSKVSRSPRLRVSAEEKKALLAKVGEAKGIVERLYRAGRLNGTEAWLLGRELALLGEQIRTLTPVPPRATCYKPTTVALIARRGRGRSYWRLLQRRDILAKAVAKGAVSSNVAELVETLISVDLERLEGCRADKDCGRYATVVKRVRRLLRKLRVRRRKRRRR